MRRNQWSVPFHVFDQATDFHERNSWGWQPQNGRSDGESRGCIVGRPWRQWPHSCCCRAPFSSAAATPIHATATAMHFPPVSGLMSLTDELTKEKYLNDTFPFSRELEAYQYPPGALSQKLSNSKESFSLRIFFASCIAGPIVSIDFLWKLKMLLPLKPTNCFFLYGNSHDRCPACLSGILKCPTRTPAPVDTADTPLLPMQLVRDLQVKLSQPWNQCKRSPIDLSVSTPWQTAEPPSAQILLATEPPLVHPIPASLPAEIQALLEKFLSIPCPGDLVPNPTHGVEHHIHMGGHPPVVAKARHLDPDKHMIAKAEFKRLESAGIIQRSTFPGASPLHMVPKKDGSWRPCGDYCRLNMVTTQDQYPLTNMQDFWNGLHDCTIFSNIDLMKGYHQIPVVAEDITKTAFIVPFGLLGCPMRHRLFNAWWTMWSAIWRQPFPKWMTHGSALQIGKHTSYLEVLFAALAANDIAINLEKCVFAVPTLEF